MDAPASRRIDSQHGFVAALHEALECAWVQRAHRMLWVDTDFADWPLDDALWLQRLGDWLRLPQRQLLLLATDYEALRRRHPRFTALYRWWSHAISARAPVEDDAAPLPCLLLVERTVAVHLADETHRRGWIGSDPAALRLWQERGDALLQRTQAAFAVTTLGL